MGSALIIQPFEIGMAIFFTLSMFYLGVVVVEIREIVRDSKTDLTFVKKLLESNAKLRKEVNILREKDVQRLG